MHSMVQSRSLNGDGKVLHFTVDWEDSMLMGFHVFGNQVTPLSKRTRLFGILDKYWWGKERKERRERGRNQGRNSNHTLTWASYMLMFVLYVILTWISCSFLRYIWHLIIPHKPIYDKVSGGKNKIKQEFPLQVKQLVWARERAQQMTEC